MNNSNYIITVIHGLDWKQCQVQNLNLKYTAFPDNFVESSPPYSLFLLHVLLKSSKGYENDTFLIKEETLGPALPHGAAHSSFPSHS